MWKACPMLPDPSRFAGRRVLVVGDLMLDAYLYGEVERISPEAPVQVVHVQREEFALGGAANVIANLVSLGARVSVASVTGPGPSARLLARRLQRMGVEVGGIVSERGRTTTRKTRVVAAGQHVLRIDHESREAVAGETLAALRQHIAGLAAEADVVLVSDYRKGVVTRPVIEAILGALPRGVALIVDPKGQDFSLYRGATLLTPNRREAALASTLPVETWEELQAAAERLRQTAGVPHLLLTCGKEGMALFEHGKALRRIGASARQVLDVSGAGDTVLAVVGLGLASGLPLADSAELASIAAGIVVGKTGTATVTPAELAAALNPDAAAPATKQRRRQELAEICASLRQQGKRVVFTNGCFDLLHAGHITLLAAARQLGDALVVAIDDDDSVRRLKGPNRPVLGAEDRIRVLSAIDSVDHVVVFTSGELESLLAEVKPDVLTKGSNYSWEEVQGRSLVEGFGGRVALIPITEDVSASRIIDAIRGSSRPQ
jgi:D-beta-D-heptose 7-phosphate kinase/D-beta-D-heptose 1-phosphate adenosyltransferase